jgi:alpha-beta hydrolase superfamily lysophospholipase
MRSTVLEFANERGALSGVLTLPDGAARALVVLVSGSGPATEDGISERQRIVDIRPPFLVWAEKLACAGFACFRYPKRVAAYASKYRTGELVCTGIADEYLSDLDSALVQLKGREGFGPSSVVLVGHSLGGIACLLYAAREPVRGVATIAAPVDDIVTTLKRQYEGVLEPAQHAELMAALDRALCVEAAAPVFGAPPAYWRNYARYPLNHMLERVPTRVPVLLLHGTQDPMIPHEGFGRLASSITKDHIQFTSVPNGDHFLMVRRPVGPGDDGEYDLAPLFGWLDQILTSGPP